MRKLLYIILAIITSIVIVVPILLTHCGSHHNICNCSDTIASDITEGSEETSILYDPDCDTTDYSLIAKYNNIVVYWDPECSSRHLTDDMDNKEGVLLKRYVNDILYDSSIIVGPYNDVIGRNYHCLVLSGVDTVKIDIRKPLPRIINTRRLGELPGCKNYRISKHYALSDSAWTTDFQLNISISDSTLNTMFQFISTLIRDDVVGYFANWNDEDERSVPQIIIYHTKMDNINSMMDYYYRQFCKLYNKEFNDTLTEENVKNGYWNTGDRYSYQLYVYPVWENSDKSLTTWRFYTYGYMGGAHGCEKEYYLTFDNKTGRILGIRDFFKKNVIPQVYERLATQLNIHFGKCQDSQYCLTADLSPSLCITATESDILNEIISGKHYPRPAITNEGIVFTYQAYEKGSNADGILHFTQPYKQDFKLKK